MQGLVIVGADVADPTARQLLEAEQAQQFFDTNSRVLPLPVETEMLVLRHLATCIREASALIADECEASLDSVEARSRWGRWTRHMRTTAFGPAAVGGDALGESVIGSVLNSPNCFRAAQVLDDRFVSGE